MVTFKKSLFFIVLLFCAHVASAQEVYLSVSGKQVKVLSGDNKHQYDYWLRPSAGQAVPKFEIYDAGLGGFSDIIDDGVDTKTTFEIFRFDDLYAISKDSLQNKSATATAIAQITLADEPRYLNRWVEILTLEEPQENGFVLRVSSGDGNDVNNFKLRFTGNEAKNWSLVVFDLSFGLFQSTVNDRVQIRPLYNDSSAPEFVVRGEEDSEVTIVDAFGEVFDHKTGTPNWQSKKYGIENSWALVVKGSRDKLNNLAIFGKENPVAWIFEPLMMRDDQLPTPEITQLAGADCQSVSLKVAVKGFGLEVNKAVWIIEKARYNGTETSHTFSNFGTFTAEVLLPTQNIYVPKYLVSSKEILVNQPPQIRVKPTPRSVSPAQRVSINAAESFDPEGKEIDYLWYVNGDYRGRGPNFAFSSTISGNYSIRLVASDGVENASCNQSDTTISIIVNTQPYIEVQHPRVIARKVTSTFRVSDALDSDGDELQFLWTGSGVVGDANLTGVNIRHDSAGTYSVVVSANDGTGTTNASYSVTSTYKVNAEPIPQFSMPALVAPNQEFAIDATASSDPDLDKLSYKWEISDNRILTSRSETIKFSTPGLYTVKLSVDDGEKVENSVQSISKQVRVNEAPVAVIEAPEKTNFSLITFSGAKSSDSDHGIASYSWDFGDGNSGSGKELLHLYEKSGTYTVALTVDDGTKMNNARTRIEQKLVINKNPIATIQAPEWVAPTQPFKVDGGLSRDDDGKISAYEWMLNGKVLSTEKSPTISIPESGKHAITLKVTDDSGFPDATAMTYFTINANYAPVIYWKATPPITAPKVTTYFNASDSFDRDADRFDVQWIFDDGVRLTGYRANREFPEPGTYGFTIKADDGRKLANSVTEIRGSIAVNQSPIVVTEPNIRSNSRTVFLDASKSYDADRNPLSFSWTLPDGSKRTESSFSWTAPKDGVHRIGLTVSDGMNLANSVDTESITITVNRAVVAVVDTLVQACSGQIIIFSSARSYDPDGDLFTTEWDFGDGNTSRDSNPYHTYAKPGNYAVKLTLSDGFSDSPTIATIPVIIEGSPRALTTFTDTTICVNTAIDFDGSPSTDPNGVIGAYSWDFGDEKTAFGPQVTHFYSEPGIYEAVLTVIGSGTGNCSNMSQEKIRVRVIEGPEATFEIPKWVAVNQKISFDPSASSNIGDKYKTFWEVTDETGAIVAKFEENKPSFSTPNPGLYTVTLRIEVESSGNCNVSQTSRKVRVNAQPKLEWNVPDQLAEFEPYILSAQGSADSDGILQEIRWKLDDKELATGLSVALPILKNGKHTVELTLRDNANVGNSVTSQKQNLFINAAPVVGIKPIPKTYHNDTVTLVPVNTKDADGDVLQTRWEVDGQPLTGNTFKAEKSSYTVTLIQDDNRKLSNSEARVSTVVDVVMAPEFTFRAYERVVKGEVVKKAIMGIESENIKIEQNGSFSDVWKAEKVGKATIKAVWRIDGRTLGSLTKEIEVFDQLSAKDFSGDVKTPWNPANPFVKLTAPKSNRENEEKLNYEWKSQDRIVGFGKVVKLPISAGENEFEVIISEEGIAGSQPVSKKVKVISQN